MSVLSKKLKQKTNTCWEAGEKDNGSCSEQISKKDKWIWLLKLVEWVAKDL